jgi:hypothetical protein
MFKLPSAPGDACFSVHPFALRCHLFRDGLLLLNIWPHFWSKAPRHPFDLALQLRSTAFKLAPCCHLLWPSLVHLLTAQGVRP